MVILLIVGGFFMKKKVIAVLFGGASSEHEVSRRSATSIIENISKEKYEIILIGITKKGEWFQYTGDISKIPDGEWEKDTKNMKKAFISPDTSIGGLVVIENEKYSTIKIDAVIPVLHGKNGEDGTIQGLFQLAKIPFVGCNLLSSATCMDKIDTNIILTYVGIKKAKFAFVTENDFNSDKEKCINYIEKTLPCYPLFVKPSNAGSSVGVSKVLSRDELIKAVEIALCEDSRILIEENISGQEVECAVLGNENPIASIVGEIAPANDFYDYEAKYINDNSKLYIPARISDEISNKIREIAIKAYKVMGCSGLSRIDFFVEKDSNEIYLNELNTFPGFTSISMYPKLFENTGIPYSELIDRLLNLAFER